MAKKAKRSPPRKITDEALAEYVYARFMQEVHLEVMRRAKFNIDLDQKKALIFGTMEGLPDALLECYGITQRTQLYQRFGFICTYVLKKLR